MSKMVILKTEQASRIKRQFEANAYIIRENFRMAVVCQSIELNLIPETGRLQYLRSVLTSRLSPKCRDVIEEKLYAILYSDGLAFWQCNFKVENGWFTNSKTGCMVTVKTKRVDGKLLIAAASCEATQEQSSFRFLAQIFDTITDMTSDNLQMLLEAICIEEIEAEHKQQGLSFIDFRLA